MQQSTGGTGCPVKENLSPSACHSGAEAGRLACTSLRSFTALKVHLKRGPCSDRRSLELAGHLYIPVPSACCKSWGHHNRIEEKDILFTLILAIVPTVHERPSLCI